jgi:hypothetical protein
MEVHGFNVKEFDISINVPQADGKNSEGGSASNHKNYLWGMGCSHACSQEPVTSSRHARHSIWKMLRLLVLFIFSDLGGRISIAWR